MTKEELLQKRYKVVGTGEHHYPGSHLKPGVVISENYGRSKYDYPNDFHLYPHLFRELHWSDERSIEDMPGYLKYQSNPYPEIYPVFKVEKWYNVEDEWRYGIENRVVTLPVDFMPATEQEYLDYIA